MAFVIGSDCIACGACADACPAGAISMGDEHYEIDQDKCLQCGACVDTCPTGAISEKQNVVHSKSLLQCGLIAAGSLIFTFLEWFDERI